MPQLAPEIERPVLAPAFNTVKMPWVAGLGRTDCRLTGVSVRLAGTRKLFFLNQRAQTAEIAQMETTDGHRCDEI